MKKLLTITTTLLAFLIASVSFADNTSPITPPVPIPGPASGKTSNNTDAVNISNNTGKQVYVTFFLWDIRYRQWVRWGTPYQPWPVGVTHVNYYNPPYSKVNLQASCWPNGSAVVGGEFKSGQTFNIPYGAC